MECEGGGGWGEANVYKPFLIQDGPAIELTAASKKKISSIAIFLGVSTHTVYIYTHLPLRDFTCSFRMKRMTTVQPSR